MFGDAIQQADGVGIGLACGFCNQPASEGHSCKEMEQWKLKNSETSSTLEDASAEPP